ncbi:SusC/RagA family TonB-linked outer membrane protein [Mucilaginibacter lacusdianchii]|uniref:SusC/RagA family TonB-linked outer membrane protein n=1 Tax=Mucilaginibacter lacusdianchii TaxID=2684211 RepID=UPI001E28459A|nr:TonB-dependent receptor [Mucilaginibacter sp. JXJ CY 39]
MRKTLPRKYGISSRMQWPPNVRCPKVSLVILSFFAFLLFAKEASAQIKVSGSVIDTTGQALIGVAVKVRAAPGGSTTDVNGKFTITVPSANSILTFSYVGYDAQDVPLNGQTAIRVRLRSSNSALQEVVVTGFGSQKKESVTGSISSVTSKDIERVHAGTTVSTTLAGKLPGVTFRQAEGRPGASASIQIRNMGRPLYVIDGIQQDEGQFNNLAPNDIENISVLKDASAAIYGVLGANGVIVVTTKKGAGETRINVDANYGMQNWTRFPNVVNNAYDYMRYRAEAEVNSFGTTSISPAELEKYRIGTERGYQSFDWRDYVLNSNANAPLSTININFTGGSDKFNYYVSGTHFYQNSQMGKEYEFSRNNIQSNVSAKVANGLRISLNMNGRIESRENPGVPGGDDYFLARFAVLRNKPTERPYANDNPNYLNTISNNESNYAFLNKKTSGVYRSDWRVVQTNFNAEYEIPGIKGLVAKGVYSYYYADNLTNNHEYTYDTYTYQPATDTYLRTGGSNNPWREREQIKNINTTAQLQLIYNNTFGKHTFGGLLVAERLEQHNLRNWLHAIPTSNNLPLIYFPTVDTYDDSDNLDRRVGYIARFNYNYANKYYLELSGRRDASYLFAPDQRAGYFPGGSVGWRITEEKFMKNLLGANPVLNDFKFRASYGVLGDYRDPYDQNSPVVPAFKFVPGYNYNSGSAILNGNNIVGARDQGGLVTQLSWTKSRLFDVGADFALLNSKLTGTIDYFYRKRTGLPQIRIDRLVPSELGYDLPKENLESDAQYGEELSLNYNNTIGKVRFNIGGNIAYTRAKTIDRYNPQYTNSWDKYRNSAENRFRNIDWGQEVIGQFTSQEQINTYPVNIDGKGNTSLLPGDLIYKDQNGDGKIDDYDQRPIGFGYGQQPNINFGFTLGVSYKNIDFRADFSGASGYTWFQNYETRWAFQNDGNLNSIFEDRWHHADPYDVNSQWIPGKYPANRRNPGNGHSDYGWNSTYWLHNITYLRARTLEIGYSLPASLLTKVKIKRARFYVNGYNMFSFDNMKQYGLDPETIDDNGLQFPQNRVLSFGVNLTF